LQVPYIIYKIRDMWGNQKKCPVPHYSHEQKNVHETKEATIKYCDEILQDSTIPETRYYAIGIKAYIYNIYGDIGHGYGVNPIDHGVNPIALRKVLNPPNRIKYYSYTKRHNIRNKTLLWHGTPITNLDSLLKNGFVLDSEKLGVAVTQRRFGKGIYFTNCVIKSAEYTRSELHNGIGALLLCEVALGNQLITTEIEKEFNPKILKQGRRKKHSVWARGQKTPNSKEKLRIGGTSVTIGKLKNSHIASKSIYDEFIVYNVKQVKIRYVVLFSKGNS
jgi:hypothetical protein